MKQKQENNPLARTIFKIKCHNVFDFTRTNDFQYQCQFVDSDNIIRGDQRNNVHITHKSIYNIIRGDQRKNFHITHKSIYNIIRGDQRKNSTLPINLSIISFGEIKGKIPHYP